MLHRNAFCWCGSGKKWKKCHYPHTERAPFDLIKKKYWDKYKIIIKSGKEIEGIKQACHKTAKILDEVSSIAKAGVTTKALDDYCRTLIAEKGGIPASLGYGDPPYPMALCTSLNEVICHGIPNETPLKEGDILNIDIGAIFNGYFGDCSKMVSIGEIDEEKKRVIDCSYEALMTSIALLKPGLLIFEIGQAIEAIAALRSCSVVNQFVGHGVGIQYHENPQIPHHKNESTIPLVSGMIFTIEPMINAGKKEAVVDPHDKWTARTLDNKPSAQWEHTLLITDSGYEILTPWTL